MRADDEDERVVRALPSVVRSRRRQQSRRQMQRPQAAARKLSPIHPLRNIHWILYRLPNPDCWNSRNPSFVNTTICNYNHSCRCCYTRIILTADMKDVPLGYSAEEEPPYHRAYASCGTRHALLSHPSYPDAHTTTLRISAVIMPTTSRQLADSSAADANCSWNPSAITPSLI